MNRTRICLIIIVFSGFFSVNLLGIAAGFISQAWKVPPRLPEYQVLRVIDGDTIEVEQLGKVRYTGIDTPEIYPPKAAEPYGMEATLANKRLVAGRKVRLEFDVRKRDKYRRILAYVYIDSTYVNAYLLEAGYAQLMTIPPNVKYADLFHKLQQLARQAGRGLWRKNSKISKVMLFVLFNHLSPGVACKTISLRKENPKFNRISNMFHFKNNSIEVCSPDTLP